VAMTEAEMVGLMREHEAIRAHIKLLINSLGRLAAQLERRGTQCVQIRDLVCGYRWALYDFRDGILRHLELDERTFEPLSNDTAVEDLAKEHEKIREALKSAVCLADNVASSELGQEELIQFALGVKEAVDGLCEVIDAHTTREDALLITLRKVA
jgi:hypothetical protein